MFEISSAAICCQIAWVLFLYPLSLTGVAMVLSDTLLATNDPNKNDYLVHCHIIHKRDEPLRGIGG
jgi:hypothetical protein